jgi:hypothetical protein
VTFGLASPAARLRARAVVDEGGRERVRKLGQFGLKGSRGLEEPECFFLLAGRRRNTGFLSFGYIIG